MFDDFIKKLKNENRISSTYCTNHYSEKAKNNEITTNNLKLYLENIYKRNPKYLFIGEAPGHKGCRISGVPFTAECNLMQNYGSGLFGTGNGFKIVNKNNPEPESSANTVWQYFKNSKFVPFFWNAFPFHPHKENNPNSNRKPDRDLPPPRPLHRELDIGFEYILDLAQIFEIEYFIAIGKAAYELLQRNKKNCKYVRHPSHGGHILFAEGMSKLEEQLI